MKASEFNYMKRELMTTGRKFNSWTAAFSDVPAELTVKVVFLMAAVARF